jgi:hypothetical protein
MAIKLKELSEYRARIVHKIGRPLVLMETGAHGSYLFFAFMERNGMYSTMAGVVLFLLLTVTVLGAE